MTEIAAKDQIYAACAELSRLHPEWAFGGHWNPASCLFHLKAWRDGGKPLDCTPYGVLSVAKAELSEMVGRVR